MRISQGFGRSACFPDIESNKIAEDRPIRELPLSLDEVVQARLRLENVIEGLLARLDPVLRDGPAGIDGEMPSDRPSFSTKFALLVSHEARSIDSLVDQLAGILSRIEV